MQIRGRTFSPDRTHLQSVVLTRLAEVDGNVQALIATSGNCELFAQSGERHPYKEVPLGALKEGGWADMLLLEGDPTQAIAVLRDHEKNLAVILKDSKVHRNTLAPAGR